MFKLISINSEKGAALIICYSVIVVLMILLPVLFVMSISEKNLVEREKDGARAFYLAERGLEYAYYEIISGPWPSADGKGGWRTHYVASMCTETCPDDPNLLEQLFYNSAELPTGFVNLSNTCEMDLLNENSPTYGCYIPLDSSADDMFAVKTYATPYQEFTSTTILSKGISGSSEVILAMTVSSESLYKYFIFSPGGLEMLNANYNAGDGAIHANDDIQFVENVSIVDISELSTAGSFKYRYTRYVPPDDPFFGGPWGRLPQGETWRRTVFPTTAPPWWYPYVDEFGNEYFYNNPDGHLFGDWWGAQTTLPIPRMPNLGAMIKIWPDGSIPNGEKTILNVLTGGPARYPIFLYEDIPEDYQQYMPDGSLPTLNVDFLHSGFQHDAWTSFLDINDLDEILLDGLTGGYEIEPLTIAPSGYLDSAKVGGLFIKKQSNGGLYVKLNNQEYGTCIDAQGVPLQCLNPDIPTFIREQPFTNTNSGKPKNFIMIDVERMIRGGPPGNGIIYSTLNTGLENASVLPATDPNPGLTTVTQGDILFYGNYNVDDGTPETTWQPSAVITAKLPIFTSPAFDFPQSTRATLNHMEQPYSEGTLGEPGYYNEGFGVGSNFTYVDPQNPQLGLLSNWYYQQGAGEPGVDNMPNKVTLGSQEGCVYNTSIIGKQALNFQALERWEYFVNPGDLNNPPSEDPSNWQAYTRTVQGAFVVLERYNFEPNVNYEEGPSVLYFETDPNYTGGIDTSAPRGDEFGGSRDLINHPGWPGNMTSKPPGRKRLNYETRYFPADGEPQLPPGSLAGYSESLWMPVSDFEHHDPAICFTPPYQPPLPLYQGSL